MKKDWFCSWFNSPYYPVLYKDRDMEEAQFFIDNLLQFIKPVENARILDIACGRGRHSLYLNQKGFNVVGIDLSDRSIEYAKQFENEKLSFFIHDMRKPSRINYFDYALNLFTSFGYFEKEEDNIKAINSFAKALKPSGTLVLDYMNTKKIVKFLIQEEIKTIENITFKITRNVKDGFIIKKIAANDNSKIVDYEEKVRLIALDTFEKYFDECGLKIIHVFGDYHLNKYNEEVSDRLILLAERKG